MVGAGDVIADRLGRVPPQEHAAGVTDAVEQCLRVVRRDLEMLGREPVDQRHRLGERRHDDHCAVRVPCGARDLGGGERTDLAIHRRRDPVGEACVVGEEDRLGDGVVLGLA